MEEVTVTEASASKPSDEVFASNKKLTHIIYGMYAAAPILGVTFLIGIIMNYIKRENVKGTYLESHFDWQIKTFWWTLGLSFVGALLSIVGIGILILIGVGIWYIYRIVKGWLKLNDGQPIIVEKKEAPNQPA